MKKKSFVLLILIGVILLFSFALAESNIEVFINNKHKTPAGDLGEVYLDTSTNRLMVPIRFVAEELGAEVRWVEKTDDSEALVIISRDDREIKIQIKQKLGELTIGGKKETIELENPPLIKNSRTYVPIRFISESLGDKVEWLQDEKFVLINSQPENLEKITTSINDQAKKTSITSESKNVLGKNIKFVKLDMKDDVKLEQVSANDMTVGSEAISSMINRKKPLVAINGNFFDSYKTLEPMGPMMRNGHWVHMVSSNGSFVEYEDGSLDIDLLNPRIDGYLDNKRKNEWNNDTSSMEFNTFGIHYVNHKPTDSSGIYLYNHYRPNIGVDKGSVIYVVDNLVKEVKHLQGKENLKVPENGYIIYYGPDNDPNYVNARFKTGRSVQLESVLLKNNKLVDKKIKTLVSAGPVIVLDGKNVSSNLNNFNWEGKISTNRSQRSAIGIDKNNNILLITGNNMNMDELAKVMIELGAVKAMNLDGGASSALYANGKYLQKPGRNLNNMLMVIEK